MSKNKMKRWRGVIKAVTVSSATLALTQAFAEPVPRKSIKGAYPKGQMNVIQSSAPNACAEFEARWVTVEGCHYNLTLRAFEPLNDDPSYSYQRSFLGDAEQQLGLIAKARDGFGFDLISIREPKISAISANDFQFMVKIHWISRKNIVGKGLNGTVIVLGQFSTESGQPEQYKITKVTWLGMEDSQDVEELMRNAHFEVLDNPSKVDQKTTEVLLDMFLKPYVLNYLPTSSDFGPAVSVLSKKVSTQKLP